MRVIMDEIEVGMRIRKLNKDEDDNHFIKIGEGYKGPFIQVDEIKRVYYDEEEEGLLCETETSPWLPLV